MRKSLFACRHLPPAQLGRLGERRAAWFYRLRGYRVIEKNFRSRNGEVDMIVRRGRTIAIVEVKTRQTDDEGWRAVDRRKREKLVAMGWRFIARIWPATGMMLRYDVLSLRWTGRRFVAKHFPDAFRPVADPRFPWRYRV